MILGKFITTDDAASKSGTSLKTANIFLKRIKTGYPSCKIMVVYK